MATARPSDPYRGLRFRIEVEGVVVGGFSEVSGLEIEVDTEEYAEGGTNDFVHVLPKGTKYGRVVLQRGITQSDTLWKWQSDVRNGKIERHTVHIVLLDEEGEDAWDWRCLDAYPTKWAGPDFNATDSKIAVERLELAHKGIRSG